MRIQYYGIIAWLASEHPLESNISSEYKNPNPKMILKASQKTAKIGFVLDYTILYHIILNYIILYYIILYYTILYYTILYYTILYYTILYYTILYDTILYYIILCYDVDAAQMSLPEVLGGRACQRQQVGPARASAHLRESCRADVTWRSTGSWK